MSESKIVMIDFVYFKPSGKYYADGRGEFPKKMFEGCIYPRDYAKRLEEKKMLPGLMSGTWNGPYTVHPENSYPELVLGEEK